RRVNDGMGAYVADELIKQMLWKDIAVAGSEVLILGFTFKENCPDVRNTKVIDVIRRLEKYKVKVCIHDPWADPLQVKHEYGVICMNGEAKQQHYDAILLAVAHDEFKKIDLSQISKNHTVVYDIKSMFPLEMVDARL
ncbi:MAG TPA: UDP binding domain-containing protein, partial [Daejeonella sp.]|nr:UDP binding domain-containing protein [Daejeonella sp.]